MSVKAMDWAFKQDVTPAGKKFVLVCIADHADARGYCYPGQKRLAQMTGLEVFSIRRHVIALEQQGLIQRYERRNRKGFKTTDGYRLLAELGVFEEFEGDVRDILGERIASKRDELTDVED